MESQRQTSKPDAANHPRCGHELDLAPPHSRKYGEVALATVTVDQLIQEQRNEFVSSAVADVEDPGLRAIVADAANSEFDSKIRRIRAAFSKD